tara:strand:- start:129 stop:356 length:228 start_codon:yes stop_codon:yes gene_type:complete
MEQWWKEEEQSKSPTNRNVRLVNGVEVWTFGRSGENIDHKARQLDSSRSNQVRIANRLLVLQREAKQRLRKKYGR